MDPARSSRLSSLTTMRVPEQPSGWPRVIAPPSALTSLMSLDALDAWANAMNTTVVEVLTGVYPFGVQVRPKDVEVMLDARFRSGS